MLIVTCEAYMLSVVILNVIMLSVIAPFVILNLSRTLAFNKQALPARIRLECKCFISSNALAYCTK
jgi:hypothetical protein